MHNVTLVYEGRTIGELKTPRLPRVGAIVDGPDEKVWEIVDLYWEGSERSSVGTASVKPFQF